MIFYGHFWLSPAESIVLGYGLLISAIFVVFRCCCLVLLIVCTFDRFWMCYTFSAYIFFQVFTLKLASGWCIWLQPFEYPRALNTPCFDRSHRLPFNFCIFWILFFLESYVLSAFTKEKNNLLLARWLGTNNILRSLTYWTDLC